MDREELKNRFIEEIGEIVYKNTLRKTIRTLATNDTLDFIEKLLKESEDKAREEGYREGRREMYEMHKELSKLLRDNNIWRD